MKRELISRKTRYEFQEWLVGKTLREIEVEFDAADITCDYNFVPNMSGQRRSLVAQYYHSIDWTSWPDIRKILAVYQNILVELQTAAESAATKYEKEIAAKNFAVLVKWLRQDGFEFASGILRPIGKVVELGGISQIAHKFDSVELHRMIGRMQNSVDDDPSLAIGTAKEIIETTCKTILEERGLAINLEWDTSRLVKETREVIGLLPESVPESARGKETIRKILGSLASIGQGLAELRNLYGTGHGKSARRRGLSARHARLAVGMAAALATFLFETHEERDDVGDSKTRGNSK